MRRLVADNTITGKVLIATTLLCNLSYIGLAIHRSHLPHAVEECIDIHDPRVMAELVLVIELPMFTLVRVLASEKMNPVRLCLQPHTVVDILTLPHIFIALYFGVDWMGLRSLRFIWLTQITQVLQFTPLLRSQTAVDILNLVIYFLVLWFMCSGILFLVETQGDFWVYENTDPHELLFYVYLTIVTMSTVGYGDFTSVVLVYHGNF